MNKKRQKNIPNIIDCKLKKDYQILIAFVRNISEATGHQKTVQVLTSSNVCFGTTCENQNKRNMPLNEQKTSINFIFFRISGP